MHTCIKNYLGLFVLTVLIYGCSEPQKESAIDPDSSTKNAVYVSSEQGEQWNVLGVKITGKVLSDQTNGEYSVIITETPANSGPPMHVHENEDELFYVLKGNFMFTCGDEKIELNQGDMLRLPKGIPHNFVNIDSTTGITMNTITPGGFEHFFEEISNASENKKLTKSEIDSIAQRYGVSFTETL
ncbi:MAG: hypothetical protein COA58_02630 [Bacteroidetes bacterium]|nr:MAG: hypothetical protein COA58_02630 [Bacteroidota bacterium]